MRRLLVHVFGREVLDIALARLDPTEEVEDEDGAASGEFYDEGLTDVGLGFAPPAVWLDDGGDE